MLLYSWQWHGQHSGGDAQCHCSAHIDVITVTLTWREKARRAGIGINAAIKKAVTLLMDVRATLAPVRLRHSPVLS